MKKNKSSQNWLQFKNILENGIIETEQKYLKILKVIPINYELKTLLEKEAILNAYKIFLKTCDFDIQILIKSRSENIKQYIDSLKIESKKYENKALLEYYEEYFKFLKKLNRDNQSSSKDFYIVISETANTELSDFNKINLAVMNLNEKISKIKESLSRCGNFCSEIKSKEEIILFLKSLYNARMDFLEKSLNEI